MMKGDKAKLLSLFERKINLLLENNTGYARFKKDNPAKQIKKILSNKDIARKDIIDLGFLIHLQALKFRLTMYKKLIPCAILNFKKDLQKIINAPHSYQRHWNPISKPFFKSAETFQAENLIPPLIEITEQTGYNADNPELYNEILSILEGKAGKMALDIPEEIIQQMQDIDLKKIYSNLPELVEKKKEYTVRKLAGDFPVFENDKLSLVSVFNEVLFLANEGKIKLWQMEGDVGLSVSVSESNK